MLPKKWQNVRFAIYNFSGSSSMTKPKSYVPKERTEQQKAILDEARKRAHAVLREKNKIVKSMKEEKAETQEKKEACTHLRSHTSRWNMYDYFVLKLIC